MMLTNAESGNLRVLTPNTFEIIAMPMERAADVEQDKSPHSPQLAAMS